jgi:hypothetical protein
MVHCVSTSGGTVLFNNTACELVNCSAGYEPTALKTCQACTPGKYSTKSLPCVLCASNTFTLRNASSACFLCNDPGLTCTGGSATVQPGRWAHASSDSNTIETFACPPGYCVSTAIGSVCADNRYQSPDNILCGQCKPGFSEWGGVCVGEFAAAQPLLACFVAHDVFVHRSLNRLPFNQWRSHFPGHFADLGLHRVHLFFG